MCLEAQVSHRLSHKEEAHQKNTIDVHVWRQLSHHMSSSDHRGTKQDFLEKRRKKLINKPIETEDTQLGWVDRNTNRRMQSRLVKIALVYQIQDVVLLLVTKIERLSMHGEHSS